MSTSNYCYFWSLCIQKVFTLAEYFATDGVNSYTIPCGIDIWLTCVLGFLLTKSWGVSSGGFMEFTLNVPIYLETSTRGLKQAK